MARDADDVDHAMKRMAEPAYAIEPDLSPAEFIAVLNASGLGARRPVGDSTRIARMIAGASLIVTARLNGTLVGVARSITDFARDLYLCDLAVDREWQGRGIGRALIARTRAEAGEECMCLLTAAPEAVSYYEAIGMPRIADAFRYPRAR